MPTSYAQLADVLLGEAMRPFAGFRAPPDMSPSFWYGSVFSQAHADLAEFLVGASPTDGWILELGSYIGGSAATWARAARARNRNMQIVCVDTWLGDAIMW